MTIWPYNWADKDDYKFTTNCRVGYWGRRKRYSSEGSGAYVCQGYLGWLSRKIYGSLSLLPARRSQCDKTLPSTFISMFPDSL